MTTIVVPVPTNTVTIADFCPPVDVNVDNPNIGILPPVGMLFEDQNFMLFEDGTAMLFE